MRTHFEVYISLCMVPSKKIGMIMIAARGDTAIYGLYRYVPLWRVWFSSSLSWDRVYKSESLGLEEGIILSVCLFVYFFLHLFILQAIYVVLQDWRIKDAVCRIKYQVTRINGEGRI